MRQKLTSWGLSICLVPSACLAQVEHHKITTAQSLIRKYSQASADLPLAGQRKAADDFEKALSVISRDDRFYVKAWYDLGTDLWRLGELKRAVKAFEVAENVKPSSLQPGFRAIPIAAASQKAMVLGDLHSPLPQRLSAWSKFEKMLDPNDPETPTSRMTAKGAMIDGLIEEASRESCRRALSSIKSYIKAGSEGKLSSPKQGRGSGTEEWKGNGRIYLRNLASTSADIRELDVASATQAIYLREYGHGKDEISFAYEVARADKGTLSVDALEKILLRYPEQGGPRAAVLYQAVSTAFSEAHCEAVLRLGQELLRIPGEPNTDEDPAQYYSFVREATEGCKKTTKRTKLWNAPVDRPWIEYSFVGFLILGCGYSLIPLTKTMRKTKSK